MGFAIRNDVPKPRERGRYGFGRMMPGDSIFVPCCNILEIKKARAAARQWARTHPEFSYTSRVEVSSSEGKGLRIWRTSEDEERSSKGNIGEVGEDGGSPYS